MEGRWHAHAQLWLFRQHWWQRGLLCETVKEIGSQSDHMTAVTADTQT